VVLVRTEPGRLEVEKTAARERVKVGSKVKYTIVVRNTGTGPVSDVKLIDQPAKKMEFISAKPSQGSCGDALPLTCDLGTIEAGAEARVVVTASPLVTGTIQNTATASSPDPEVDPKTDRAKIKGLVELKISKKASKRRVRAGSRVTYRIRVTNPSVATVRNVKVCDRPPAGLEVIKTNPGAKLRNGSWCWNLKSIAAGSSQTLRVTAKVLKGAKGQIANVATVEGQEVSSKRTKSPIRVIGAKDRPGGVTG
jgi:large repetitive protein